MQKRLMAVAVAGALAAPAAVMAQSTVQVYGNLYMEYAFTKQGRSTPTNAAGTNFADRVDADIFQTGGSAIGFKGQEKLGGGMSAWFQCESTADPRGVSQNGWCGRNSAVGLKGGFGNFFVGNWDTPFKRARVGNIGGRDTGVFGTAFLLYGNSTTTGDGADAGVFARRQRNSINYDSPKFGGFQFMASTSTTNASTGLTSTAAEAKARVWSLGGAYAQGPLTIAAGYERHKNHYSNAVRGTGAISGLANGTTTFAVAKVDATTAGDESGYHISAAYAFGNVKVGGTFTEQEADTLAAAAAAPSKVKVKAYHVGVEWKLSGPHNVHFGYTRADDVKGLAGAQMAPVAGTSVGLRPTVPAAGTSSGADMWQVRYLHDFSKRTTGSLGYVSLKNDRGASYDLGGLNYGGNLQSSGAKQSAIAASIQHRF